MLRRFTPFSKIVNHINPTFVIISHVNYNIEERRFMEEKIVVDGKPFVVEKADDFITRLIGLMFKKKYPPQKALHITPCNAIHMFFMRFPITAIFVDEDGIITDYKKNLKEWSIYCSFFRRSKSVYEISYLGNENITPRIGSKIKVEL